MRYSLVARERADICAAPHNDYCRTRSGTMMRPKMTMNVAEMIPEDRPTEPNLELAEKLADTMRACLEAPPAQGEGGSDRRED